MRTWWLVNRDSSEVDHWYLDTDCAVYAIFFIGSILRTPCLIGDMDSFTSSGTAYERELPNEYAKSVSNNRRRP